MTPVSTSAPVLALGDSLAARGFDRLIAALAALGTLWIALIMVLICLDAIGLALWSRPLYGVVEFTEHSIVPIVFLQAAAVLNRGRLTRADFLFAPLSESRPDLAKAIDTVFLTLGAAIFTALALQLSKDLARALAGGEYFGTREIFAMPIWPFRALSLLGAGLLAAECARQALSGLAQCRGAAPWAAALGLSLALAGGLALLWWLDPGRLVLGGVVIAALMALLMAGMPVAVVMLFVGLAGIWLVRGNPDVALSALKTAATGTINKFDFGVVPLFVLMGLFTDISDIGRDAYRVAAWWSRKLLGGLGIATVAANAIFAAVTGISIASAAIFSRLAVPQMIAHGYTPRFAAGCVAGSSVLGMLLPPSLLLIVFAFVAEVSVGKLFVAALLPGLLLAVLFCLAILAMARFTPKLVGQPGAADDLEPETLVSSARRLLPIAGLVTLILGGVYLGWFTPTQAGAVGAFAAMVLTAARGRLTRANLWRVMQETGLISVAVLLLVIGASLLSKALVMSTLPMRMVDLASGSGLGFWGVLVIFLAVVVVMGMFLDSTSILVIAVPIVLPLITQLGTPVIGPDVLIWFGIVTVVAVEMGLLTPPFGISVFVVKSTIGPVCTLGEVFLGALPFVATMAVLLALLMLCPQIVTLLL